MELSFRGRNLQRRYEDSNQAIQEWGPDVGRKYIARVKQLIAAPTFQDVQNIRSLRLHALKGDRDGQFSIRLTAQWRLIVEQGATRESLVIREVTNHYDD